MPLYHATNGMTGLICFSPSADARTLAGNRRALRTTTSVNAFPSQFQPFPKYKIRAGIPWPCVPVAPGELGEGGWAVVSVLPLRYVFGNLGCFYLSIAKQLDGVNGLSGGFVHTTEENKLFTAL